MFLFFIFLRLVEGNLAPAAAPTKRPTNTPTPTSMIADMPGGESPSPTPTIPFSKSPTPTYKITDTKSITAPSGLTAEEQTYDQFMIEHHSQFNRYMDHLGGLFIQAGEDGFIFNDDWHKSVERDLELMIAEAEEIAGYEDVPDKFADVHHWLVKLEPETRQLSDNVMLAIEDEHFNILEFNQLSTSLYDIFTCVVNANVEREKIIPSGLDS
jgi:hypothetical protein